MHIRYPDEKVLLPIKYLIFEEDIDGILNLQEQLKVGLLSAMKVDFELGYCDGKQKEQLTKNLALMNNILCFFEKYWKVMLRKNFPELPQHLQSSPLLDMLTSTKRVEKNQPRK